MNFNVSFPGDSAVENLPANAGDAAGTAGSVPGLGRLLGKEIPSHSSILAWKNPTNTHFSFCILQGQNLIKISSKMFKEKSFANMHFEDLSCLTSYLP